MWPDGDAPLDNAMRPRDPIHTVGRYQRIRVIGAIVCLAIALGLLLWKILAG